MKTIRLTQEKGPYLKKGSKHMILSSTPPAAVDLMLNIRMCESEYIFKAFPVLPVQDKVADGR
jgi:hypothetical protein